MTEPTFIIAFVAGIISFLSPCVLPLIPGFLTYLSGTSSGQENVRLKIFLNSFFFVVGFSVVFGVLGILLNTFLSNSSYLIQRWLSRVGGTVVLIFAFHSLGFISLPFLDQEHKVIVRKSLVYSM